ncbi:MAG: hypothetical protein CNLJKLNK_00708 [Holosporales bacterium]
MCVFLFFNHLKSVDNQIAKLEQKLLKIIGMSEEPFLTG